MGSPEWYIYTVTPKSKVQGKIVEDGLESLEEPEDQDVSLKIMSSRYFTEILQPSNFSNMLAEIRLP